LESRITRAIWRATCEDWLSIADTDVVIVGAGPAGLTASTYLAECGFKVVVFERRLSFGGGMGGGGMLLHKIVVDDRALPILDKFKVRYAQSSEAGLFTVDSAELIAKLAAHAIDSGAKIILGVAVEDVIIRDSPLRLEGAVIQWSAVQLSGLHVDPLFIHSRALVDATGHDAEVLRVVERKNPGILKVAGEKSAHAELGEKEVVEGTGKVIDGLYVAGMAAAALHGTHRMGPIFSGMLLSGRKVAELVAKDLGRDSR